MLRVLHLLPHAGGGGERHLDILARLPETEQRRLFVSGGRSPARAVAGLPSRRLAIGRAARDADIVHAHGDMASVLMRGVLAAGPSVWTTHGLSFLRRSTGPAHAVFVRRLRAVIAAADLTICTTDAERRELLALAPDAGSRLRVIANGAVAPPATPLARRAALRRELGLGEADVVGLFAGRLDDAKGAADAVAATIRARGAGAPLTLLVAGEGPLEEPLRATARDAEGVRLLGFRDDVDALLGAADIFVLPSRREGSSYAVIEALGAGLAVVVCDGLGNPETVGDAGVVVPCGDVGALAEALADLALQPERRQALGDAARTRAQGQLGEDRFLAETAAVYREVGSDA